jgi:cell division septum initiation protein DivIVA
MSGEQKTDVELAMNACYMDTVKCQDGVCRRPHRVLTQEVKRLERENAELIRRKQRSEDARKSLADAIDKLERESAELRKQLATACDRIRDMLEGDDGQAWKEARTFLRRIGEPESIAEKKGGEVEQRGLWRWHNAEPEQGIPEELFDENAVYDELTQAERRYTTPAAVSAVLDATVSLIRMGIKKGGEQ